jgi:TPR repeat protein
MFAGNFRTYGACLALIALLGCHAEEPPLSPRAQLEERAKHGDAEAMFRLGQEDCCGIGEGKNEERAINWFCQAARQQQPDAQFILGRIYQENGLPLVAESVYKPVRVQKENSVAYAWYKTAAAHGHKLAVTSLELLKRNMNNTQMDQAETLALDPRTIPCQYQGQTL